MPQAFSPWSTSSTISHKKLTSYGYSTPLIHATAAVKNYVVLRRRGARWLCQAFALSQEAAQHLGTASSGSQLHLKAAHLLVEYLK